MPKIDELINVEELKRKLNNTHKVSEELLNKQITSHIADIKNK